jgi:hypothetical protein
MPRSLSGRHGGAVPARLARGYPRESSPQHHRRSTHTWTTGEAHTLGPPQASTARLVRRSGEVRVWRRQRGDFPSEIQPRISSQRKQPPNLFGGGGRGRRGEHFAQGGSGGVRWRQLESSGNGEAIRASQEPECRVKRGVR